MATLREIVSEFTTFWVWQPKVEGYNFEGKWVIVMGNKKGDDSFFLPDLDFFQDLDDIGDCIAVGIPMPEKP